MPPAQAACLLRYYLAILLLYYSAFDIIDIIAAAIAIDTPRCFLSRRYYAFAIIIIIDYCAIHAACYMACFLLISAFY